MEELHIGDKVSLIPQTFSSGERLINEKLQKVPIEGTVVYIHPKRRFFTAEFETKGYHQEIHKLRESFLFSELEGK